MSDRYERNVGSLIENNSEIISRDFNGNVNGFLDRELNPELTRMHLQSSDVLWEQPYTTPEGIEGVIAIETENERGFVELEGVYEDVVTRARAAGRCELAPYSVTVLRKAEED